MRIAYKQGYKYQLSEDYKITLDFSPTYNICTDYINFSLTGKLTILKGYAWDGASGPAIDTKDILRASLVHDALYQLIRQQFLSYSLRDKVDILFKNLCLDDGMIGIRAWYVHKAVKHFGQYAAKNEAIKQQLTAP